MVDIAKSLEITARRNYRYRNTVSTTHEFIYQHHEQSEHQRKGKQENNEDHSTKPGGKPPWFIIIALFHVKPILAS